MSLQLRLFRRLRGVGCRSIGRSSGSFLFAISLELLLDEDAVDLELRQGEIVDLVREIFVTLQQNDLIQKAFILQEVEGRGVPVIVGTWWQTA